MTRSRTNSWPGSLLKSIRRGKLQWSLRTLLIGMTLAAIGVTVWTRWPYEVTEPTRQLLWKESAVPGVSDQYGDLYSFQEQAHYRGVLAQYRVKHGKSELFLFNKARVVEQHFRNGVLHGEYREFYSDGRLRTEGEYRSGFKQGRWLNYLRQKQDAARLDYLLTQHWHLGKPHGLWQWEDGYGQMHLSANYEQGRVTQVNGAPVTDWQHAVMQLLPQRSLAEPFRERFAKLGETTGSDFDPSYLPSHWYDNQYFELETPFPKLDPDVYYPLVNRVPQEVHLAHVLDVTGLALTVRHGCVFLTTPDRIGAEHDPTGVSQLEVVPDTLLAKSLAAEVEFGKYTELHWNVRQALDHLRRECGVPLDDSALHNTLQPRDEDRPWIRLSRKEGKHRVRDLLGLALFRGRYKCALEQGRLVISRQ